MVEQFLQQLSRRTRANLIILTSISTLFVTHLSVHAHRTESEWPVVVCEQESTIAIHPDYHKVFETAGLLTAREDEELNSIAHLSNKKISTYSSLYQALTIIQEQKNVVVKSLLSREWLECKANPYHERDEDLDDAQFCFFTCSDDGSVAPLYHEYAQMIFEECVAGQSYELVCTAQELLEVSGCTFLLYFAQEIEADGSDTALLSSLLEECRQAVETFKEKITIE